jgi:hypothetical protein
LSQADVAKAFEAGGNKSPSVRDFSPHLRMRRLAHTDEIDLPARGRERASLYRNIPAYQRDPGSVSHRQVATLDGNRSWIGAQKAKGRDGGRTQE